MIKRISKLKNCGIFRDFKWSSSLVEFDKYNLIYGLNGSGKSTLSQALSFFAVNYDNASCPLNFEIELMEDNGISVGNRIKNQKLKHLLYVFNKDFVQKNLDTNGKLDEIIYLSKENIEIKNEMAELDKELSKIRAQKILTNKLYQEKKKTVDRLLPEIASKVKSILVSLGGISANTYANFDKRGAENYFSFSNKQLDVDIPNYDNEIEALKISLKELVLPYLDFKVSLIDTELINEFISKVKALLVKSISKQLITDYSKEILQWVETGLNLHKDTNVCIYCGGIISDERTAFLKGLFNEEYKKFKAELRNAIVTLESLKMQPILDDPISSLDSNNLFNSFAFIVSAFEKCHQFFVLTHNFTFFSLLKRKIGKDWRQGNNMYLIDNTNIMINGESVREAKIVVLPKTLKILNSDYAYNFKLIKDTVEIKNVVTDLNEYFILSNSCRKVLETFSSFKLIGKKDFDIETIKELYLISKQDEETLTIEENAKAEKIFKFVNYYSHGSKFSTIAEIDGLIGETIKIAQSVLELLLLADPVHYNSLIEATN